MAKHTHGSGDSAHSGHVHVGTALNPKVTKTLRQAQGTLVKVAGMIEEERYCPEIIQQVDSVVGLLRAVKKELLSGHLDTCVAEQMVTDKKKAVGELLKIYNLSN